MRLVSPDAKRLLPRYDDFAHLRAHLSQASDETITMCMNKHLLRGATMTELLSMAREDNRRLNGHDFLDAPRIMAHIHWCCEPQRGWLIDKNKHGVLRLVGYRGERDARIDADSVVTYLPSFVMARKLLVPNSSTNVCVAGSRNSATAQPRAFACLPEIRLAA